MASRTELPRESAGACRRLGSSFTAAATRCGIVHCARTADQICALFFAHFSFFFKLWTLKIWGKTSCIQTALKFQENSCREWVERDRGIFRSDAVGESGHDLRGDGVLHSVIDGSFHNATELQFKKTFHAPHTLVPAWSRPGPDLGPDPAQPTQTVQNARKTEIPALQHTSTGTVK